MGIWHIVVLSLQLYVVGWGGDSLHWMKPWQVEDGMAVSELGYRTILKTEELFLGKVLP